MEGFNVSFSAELYQKMEDAAIVNLITSLMPEKEIKQSRAVFRAFAKRGVSARIVLEALAEVAMEGGFENG